jgi:hypothetical protein
MHRMKKTEQMIMKIQFKESSKIQINYKIIL